MSISANYPSPVTVNGYSCRNCAEVDIARKHIDPASGKAGPKGPASATSQKPDAGEQVKAERAKDRNHAHAYSAAGRQTGGSAITGTLVDVRA